MKSKFLMGITFLLMFFFAGCFDGPWTDELDVPFMYQTTDHFCVAACIQMWSQYDGRSPMPTQREIYDYVGSYSPLGYVLRENIKYGVTRFTNSHGVLYEESPTNVGQDACIAACIASIKDFRPAIMPFYGGRHAVLVIGCRWHYENKRRVADSISFHDPQSGANIIKSAAELKEIFFNFDVNDGIFWVVLGDDKDIDDGWSGYMTFIEEGGTYYGGPTRYNPYQMSID